jgi:hypothetical protein
MPEASHQFTTRRALLRASPALAAIPAIASAYPSDDAELIDLGRRWQALEDERNRLLDREAELEAAAQLPPPAALYRRPSDVMWYGKAGDEPADHTTVNRWRRALNTPWLCGEERRAAIHARASEIIEAWESHGRAREDLRNRLGLNAVSDAIDDVSDLQLEIEKKSFELPAKSADGLRFKALLAKRYVEADEPDSFERRVLDSLLVDLGATT